MTGRELRESCIAYIADRRCPDGGYCFYRLNEPNAADTFFALDILRLFGAVDADPATARWLLSRQQDDGRYPVFETGYYALLALGILRTPPRYDPAPWVRSVVPPAPGAERPVESESALHRPYLYARLCRHTGIRIAPAVRVGLLAAVHASRTPEGGHATLVEASQALAIRAAVGAPVCGDGAAAFLQRCTHPEYGYVNVPGTSPAYLEHVAAGVAAARLLEVTPSPAAGPFVLKCLTPAGGFARSVFGGTATLETTWTAVRILRLIDTGHDSLRVSDEKRMGVL
ncbi:prenyltransferase/squalene oxidase repeat-containing protein [Methanofollis ethanolicus]|uniref:prenyltransferase/squalene oxidase repeat-containing protein n=1 Tax=Methanofollis ethanolicus TaxID=488124 RepID=UPI000836B997|nr:prenyltransferase/squalene oxidase repeat-containing protein [Methanofollis ethanolicus]